jgi:inorganic triphosphatase YgiF
VRFATDILRRWVRVRHGAALIELALDVGRIDGGSHSLPVCELEFELIEGEGPGAVTALLDAVSPWVAELGLWLDPRSKAERGDRLACGRLERAAAVPEDGADARAVLTALIRNTAEAAEFGEPEQAARARSPEVQGALLAGLRAS